MISKKKLLLSALAFSAITLYSGSAASASTAYTGMRNTTAQTIVDDMKIGWNLGNTLDAYGYTGSNPLLSETYWGNPKATHALIDKVKAAGFNTVRIPTTWYSHMGSAPNYTIDPNWLSRVEEVMNYAFDNDMYVILDLHHEEVSWLVPTNAKQPEIKDRLVKAWTQIANKFNKYGDYLIFETMNEPRVIGASDEWSGGSSENRQVINNLNLAAVNAIRATGGNNTSRCIMAPTISASSISTAVNDYVIPNNDPKVIVSLHMYSPYNFAMAYPGVSSWGTNADKQSLNAEFDAVANKFVKQGHPVIIGEFGSVNKNNTSSRAAHAEYYVNAAKSRHITPIWWDNGNKSVGAEDSWALFDRNTTEVVCPEVLAALMKGAGNTSTSTQTQSPIEVSYTVASSWNGGSTINVTIKNNGTTDINGWKLNWTLPSNEVISNMWNASYVTSGTTSSVTNLGYNGILSAGGTQSFGFNINYSGALTNPNAFTLNGNTCTVK